MNPLRILAAYLGVILIWSTTPLAIKWSGEGPGYLFGATARMGIGLICMLLVLAVLRQPLPWHRKARLAYLIGAAQIYGSMLVTYWASQFIPSGWISVVAGLTPLMTALLAALWLGERSLTAGRLLSYALGIAGLGVMFGSALEFGAGATPGIGGVLLATFLQSACAVGLKRLDARLPAPALVTGSLLLAMPAYLATWGWADGRWPAVLPLPSLASIVYLGVIATPLGFTLYFFVLQHLPATRVALITLVTPVFALLVGHAANGEPVSVQVAEGTALILGALLLHEFAGRNRKAAVPARARPLKIRGRNSPDSVP
jgi:drug/metabolite transporter (DMT)-like permease